jgi:hypothetical protein
VSHSDDDVAVAVKVRVVAGGGTAIVGRTKFPQSNGEGSRDAIVVARSTDEDVGACGAQLRDRVVVYIESGTGVQGPRNQCAPCDTPVTGVRSSDHRKCGARAIPTPRTSTWRERFPLVPRNDATASLIKGGQRENEEKKNYRELVKWKSGCIIPSNA